MNKSAFTDIRLKGFISLLPPSFRPYALLMRLDRPVGTWLLLWPCWWGVAAAGGVSGWKYYLLFALGAFIMRGAGCIINDLYDKKLDARVERTKARPLASGEISILQALLLLVVLLGLGLAVLVCFNLQVIIFGFGAMILVGVYPLAKRVTYWPQLVLGLAFNWGALLGWIAVKGELDWPALVLYAAGVFWTLGYDTIYAHQDKADDAQVGIKSLALKFGTKSGMAVGCFYGVALALIIFVLLWLGCGAGGIIFWLAACAHAAWQILGWKMDDQPDCLRRFKSNRDFGFLVWIALLF